MRPTFTKIKNKTTLPLHKERVKKYSWENEQNILKVNAALAIKVLS